MENYLSISEMAAIHHITRQTLIYYDKIGLFTPACTDENGYRYYTVDQIPFLREICFLKSIGIKLKDIKHHIENRNLTSAISLLEYHKEFVDKEIHKLLQTREFIQQRLNLFSEAQQYECKLDKPIVESFPERYAVFVPLERELCKDELHLTLMKAWNILDEYGVLPSEGFGTLILKDQLSERNVFKGAGVYTLLPHADQSIKNKIILPAGKYVCMYKYGMPYDVKYLRELIEWIDDHGYEIVGDVMDACFLDTTFYENDINVDLCQLQIPVK
ncbi:MerR family transcriptional regulator [Heyndrickxia ginsengihumi]|uniref:MerR family transcriptional regulator n=1 Tax=Heyndrickxia ginsengihumi TaxID=363870 RepID=UPI003D196531